MARLFGTDGVRGEANLELTPELAYQMGRAAALYFGETLRAKGEAPSILIGRDTRISGPMFEAALSAGICSAGGQAVIAGIIPTPAIAYLTKALGFQAGIVVSASHNPFYDNGIKFFGQDGYKLPDQVEDELEALIRRIDLDDDLYRAHRAGKRSVVPLYRSRHFSRKNRRRRALQSAPVAFNAGRRFRFAYRLRFERDFAVGCKRLDCKPHTGPLKRI